VRTRAAAFAIAAALLAGCGSVETVEHGERQIAAHGWLDLGDRLVRWAAEVLERSDGQRRSTLSIEPTAPLAAAAGWLGMIPGGGAGLAGIVTTLGSLGVAWWKDRAAKREAAGKATAERAVGEVGAYAEDLERVARLAADGPDERKLVETSDRIVAAKAATSRRQDAAGIRAVVARVRGRPVKASP